MPSSICYEQAANGVCFLESFHRGTRSTTTFRLEERWCLDLSPSAQCTSKYDGKPDEPFVLPSSSWIVKSVKTTERGDIRGFDAHERVKGRKRHIVVHIFGLLIACRVEPARHLGSKGSGPVARWIRSTISEHSHSYRRCRTPKHQARALPVAPEGWRLQIVRRRQRAFKITGLTWIVERSFAWLCRNRRLSKGLRVRRAESRNAYRKSLPAFCSTALLGHESLFNTLSSLPSTRLPSLLV